MNDEIDKNKSIAELPYPNPDAYCNNCLDHIRENDLFGFILGKIYCKDCYKFLRKKEKNK